jgi:hypothetical protein
MLAASFEQVDVKIVGSAAVFEAKRPRPATGS